MKEFMEVLVGMMGLFVIGFGVIELVIALIGL